MMNARTLSNCTYAPAIKSARTRAGKANASAAPAPNVDPEEIVKTLSEQWDKVENKGNALLIGGGGIFAIWLASTVVGAINSVPLLPKLMELVGFGYSLCSCTSTCSSRRAASRRRRTSRSS